MNLPEVIDLPLHIDPDGTIRVGSTRVTLDVLISEYLNGSSADEISENFVILKLADIHLVIGYYLIYRVEVDAYLAQRQIEAEALRLQMESDPAYKSRMDGVQAKLTANHKKGR